MNIKQHEAEIVLETNVMRLAIDRREAVYRDAIRALAKYKFWMFGYYAASWVKYNKLLKGTPYHQGNPFKVFVQVAMIERGDLDEAMPHEVYMGGKMREIVRAGI